MRLLLPGSSLSATFSDGVFVVVPNFPSFIRPVESSTRAIESIFVVLERLVLS